jgi:hypothetical protein
VPDDTPLWRALYDAQTPYDEDIDYFDTWVEYEREQQIRATLHWLRERVCSDQPVEAVWELLEEEARRCRGTGNDLP